MSKELKASNKRLLDQNARLTMRVTILELALEALGINHSALDGEDKIQALAERQHSLAASEAHPQTMIGRSGGTG